MDESYVKRSKIINITGYAFCLLGVITVLGLAYFDTSTGLVFVFAFFLISLVLLITSIFRYYKYKKGNEPTKLMRTFNRINIILSILLFLVNIIPWLIIGKMIYYDIIGKDFLLF